MYIDFEDHRPDTPRVEGALSAREGVLVSIIVHLLLFIGVLFLPDSLREVPVDQAIRAAQRPEETPRFVFMQPLEDVSKPQPKVDVEASDQDRVMSSVERPPDAANPLPFARGNSPEREEADISNVPQEQTPANENQVAAANDPSRSMLRLPEMPSAAPALKIGETATNGGLGDALRNLQRYVQQQSFNNPQGGGDAQGLIQFDSKGVDFGPWLRRFVAQVKRNWFIPQAAMLLSGHVVITFNIHRNGSLTDIEVRDPSDIGAFNQAAVNALISSNPTQPLPPEYPSDSAFFTVTFLYNEEPPANYR
jgi:TonB family protein